MKQISSHGSARAARVELVASLCDLCPLWLIQPSNHPDAAPKTEEPASLRVQRVCVDRRPSGAPRHVSADTAAISALM